MDESRYTLREFRESECNALARLLSTVDPDDPVSAESLRHLFESFRESSNLYNLVVEDRRSGELVGNGALFHVSTDSDPATLWIEGSVLPARQRQGIGSHLYDALAAEARGRKATGLRCRVWENSVSGRAFLAKRAFHERRRIWRSRLEVSSADTTPLAALNRSLADQGIEITTLSREGASDLGVLRRIYELDSATGRDVPRDGGFSPFRFEEFRQFFLGGENFLPDAWILAKYGNQYVGISWGAREPAQPQVLQQNYTGVRPEFRRRKVALALKLGLVEFAKRNGFTRIETSNDSLNQPMWTLNQALGFQKLREQIQLDRDLGEPPIGSAPPAH